ncbi:hypothetical protein J6590_010969 [Homalodisca vitripennis]|nr:hypothetical protein J6590_010969 [Homalodisca vitripennis]
MYTNPFFPSPDWHLEHGILPSVIVSNISVGQQHLPEEVHEHMRDHSCQICALDLPVKTTTQIISTRKMSINQLVLAIFSTPHQNFPEQRSTQYDPDVDILKDSFLQAQNRFLLTGRECDKLEATRKNKSYDAPKEPLVKSTSTITAVTDIVEHILDSLESGATLCVAYLFLSRFECLNHQLILEKPRTFGVDGSELACFKS